VPLFQQSLDPAQVYWLAASFELKLGVSAAWESQRSQEALIKTLKPSKMNRLQRSLVNGRVPTVAKDSTAKVSNFLTNTLKAMDAYLQDHVDAHDHWKVGFSHIVPVTYLPRT
jgi:midasin